MPPLLFLQALPDVSVPGVPAAVVPLVAHLLGALAILVVGWVVGGVLARLVRTVLRRFSLDTRLTSAVPSGALPAAGLRLDRLLAALVFTLFSQTRTWKRLRGGGRRDGPAPPDPRP